MRTFLVVVFALAAVAMGGMWLISQTEPANEATEVLAEAAPAPAAPEKSAPPEDEAGPGALSAEDAPPLSPAEQEELNGAFGGTIGVLGDGFGISTETTDMEPSTRSVGVAAAPAAPPPPAPMPEPEPVVATQSLAEQFKSREVTYNRPPSILALDHPIDVSLVINATDEQGAGAAALDGFDGTIVERDVELTDVVSAQLTGVGFDIIEQTVERQRLSPRVLNRWQWRVTPTKEGTQTLVLEIFGYADGAFEGEPLDAYRDEIMVEVKNLDRLISFARDYEPVFAIGAGVAGGLSALFGFLRFRNDRKRKKNA